MQIRHASCAAMCVLLLARIAAAWQDSNLEHFEKAAEKAIASIDLTAPEKKPLPSLPGRQLEFVLSDEPLSLPILEVNAKSIRLKYAALVTFDTARVTDRNLRINSELGATQFFPDPQLGNQNMSLSIEYRKTRGLQLWPTFAGDLFELGKRIPMGQRNPAFDDDTLADFPLFFMIYSSGVGSGNLTWVVLGSDEEEVRTRVSLLLQIYDAIWLTNQEQMFKNRQEYFEHLNQLIEQFPQAVASYEEVRKTWETVKDYELVSEQSLTDLRTQRQLTDVDLAGIKAKIEACEKLLETISEASANVINIKTTAEIELVEKTARREKLSELIDRADRRRSVAAEFETQVQGPLSYARQIREYRERYAQLLEQQSAYVPLSLKDDRITIQPIEWENARDGN